MATYKQIQDWVKKEHGFVIKTCWIAHVKHMEGLPMRKAHNRIGEDRVNPCPPDKEECYPGGISSLRDDLRR